MKRNIIILILLLIYATVFSRTTSISNNLPLINKKLFKRVGAPLMTPPTINPNQSFTIAENPASGAFIGKIDTTTAGGTTGNIIWEIKTNTDPNGNGTDAFTINSSGEINVNDVEDFNYELDNSLEITVSVSDGTGESTPAIITINITNKNEFTPVVTPSQSFTIPENLGSNSLVGTVIATDGDAETTFSDWTITINANENSNGENAFTIDPSSGEIRVNDPGDLDYEKTPSISISVNVSDGEKTSGATPIVINLTDENDNTPIITSGQTFSINENVADDDVVGTPEATDADEGTTFQNWTIENGNVDTDGDGTSAFAIDESTGQITISDAGDIDYETSTSYNIQLSVSDGTNKSSNTSITINISDENDSAPVISAGQTFSVNENATNGTSVGTVTATDNDSGTVFQNWTITNNSGAFAINANSGEITVADGSMLDYETNPSIILSVTVSDGINTSSEEQVTINLNNSNDSKPIITPGQSFSIDENSSNTTIIGTVEATDDDSSSSTFQNWTITVNANTNNDDFDTFSINASTGVITVNDSEDLDYETVQSFVISVTVSDGVNTSDATDITINLNNLNDIGPVITPGQSFNIAENSANNSSVGNIVATDGDSETPNLSDWNILNIVDSNGDSSDAFTVNSSNGEISVNNSGALDYEIDTLFTITVTVSDGVNTSDPEDIIINLNDVNDVVPIIADNQIFEADENLANGSVVGNVIASDGDRTPTNFQNWNIVVNTDPNLNGINAFTINFDGDIIVNDSLDIDFELTPSLNIEITVSDGVNTSESKLVVINIVDRNDIAPVITPNQVLNINENSPKGTVIDTIVATDEDGEDTIFWDWIISSNVDPNGNDTVAFEINWATGELTVNDPGDFDREENESLSINVTVSDGINTSQPEEITIIINDLNDVAPIVTPGQNFTIQENTPNGTILGTLIASDSDISPTTLNQWTISTNSDADNDGNGAFAIDTLSGELYVNDVDDIDIEKNMDITIEVTVSDSVNTSLPEKVIVYLTDLNDVLPEITKGQNFIVREDVQNAVSVGIVEASDGDITPTILSNWKISTNVDPDNDGIMTFAINPENGEIFINDADEIDFENDPKFYIAITVFDGVNTSIPRVITIYIDNIEDEVPVITPEQIFYVNEDAVKNTYVGIPEVKDRDAGMVIFQDWTFHSNLDTDLDGKPAFFIDNETGEIFVYDIDDIDYETNKEFIVEMTVSDGTNISSPENITIKINRILTVPDELQKDFSIFPNPVTDFATLRTEKQGLLLIINDKGQQVKQMNIKQLETPISVQNLKSGIYYFVFRTKTTTTSKKIIVK